MRAEDDKFKLIVDFFQDIGDMLSSFPENDRISFFDELATDAANLSMFISGNNVRDSLIFLLSKIKVQQKKRPIEIINLDCLKDVLKIAKKEIDNLSKASLIWFILKKVLPNVSDGKVIIKCPDDFLKNLAESSYSESSIEFYRNVIISYLKTVEKLSKALASQG